MFESWSGRHSLRTGRRSVHKELRSGLPMRTLFDQLRTQLATERRKPRSPQGEDRPKASRVHHGRGAIYFGRAASPFATYGGPAYPFTT